LAGQGCHIHACAAALPQATAEQGVAIQKKVLKTGGEAVTSANEGTATSKEVQKQPEKQLAEIETTQQTSCKRSAVMKEVEMVESEVGVEDGSSSREQKHELMTYQRKRWAVWNRRTLSASARQGRGKAGSSPRDFTQKQTGHDECDRSLKDVDAAGFMSNMAVAERSNNAAATAGKGENLLHLGPEASQKKGRGHFRISHKGVPP
jgi:hypothetical protein